MALPVVVGSQPSKVREKSEKFAEKNKLKGIKADLVRAQTEWQL